MPTASFYYSLEELTASRKYIQKEDATRFSNQFVATAKLYTLDGVHTGYIKTTNNNTQMKFMGKKIFSVNTNTTLTLGLGSVLSNISLRFTFASQGTDTLTTPTTSVAVASNGLYPVPPKVTITPFSKNGEKVTATYRRVDVNEN